MIAKLMAFMDALAIPAVCYGVLVLQLRTGHPPLYLAYQRSSKDIAKQILPLFAIIVAMILSVSIPHMGIIAICIGLWVGYAARADLKTLTNGPQLFLLPPITVGRINRYPMQLFDMWTIGLSIILFWVWST